MHQSVVISFICLLALPGLTANVQAQKTITGTVYDAGNGETLPSANISIEGTYRGTISNRNGAYALTIPDSLLPATVTIRYIGFESQQRVIEAGSDERQDFRLRPSVTQMEELVVTDEDPALGIMREVISRKQQWRQKLKTYKAEAYTRQSLSNDTSIVMITESVSTAFWDSEEGHREVLKSRKQTANIEAADNFAGVSYLPNFYDDNVEIAGFDVVGVTNPNALRYYDFKLLEQTTLDDRTVYKIEVIPERNLQPLFTGTIYVLDEAYALLEVSLKPNEVVDFPQPIQDFNSFYEQQFNNYGQEFWLPVDMRIDGDIKIKMVGLEFPRIRFRQLSRITDYEVNVSLPDSLYEDDDLFSVDSTAIDSDSLFVRNLDTVPLSQEEQDAYATLDSTATLEKAFRPTGFFSRFMDDEDDGEDSGPGFLGRMPGSLSPAVRYNRVDELYAGLRYEIKPLRDLELRVNGGYSTGYDTWGYGFGATYELFDGPVRQEVGADYRAQTRQRYTSEIYDPYALLIGNLLGYENYFDYYRNEGYRLFTRLQHRRSDLSATIGFNSEEHRSLMTNTAYDLLGQDRVPRVNPPIPEGDLRSLDLRFGYNLNESYTMGITGLRRVAFYVEHSDEDLLGSDYDFTRYTTSVDWSFPTFYQRRLLPNTLEVKLSAGTFSGTLPPQRFGITDVAPGIFSLFGSLKTQRNRPYEGEQYFSLIAEHNFRTVPFEMLGLRPLVDREWGIIVFGGAARTLVSESRRDALASELGFVPNISDGFHTEIGISVNKLLGLFRVDFAKRLDEPGFMVGVGVARLF